jgi:tRNA (guanine-N(7)-)-methyltransferase subunit TRM82
MKHPFQIVVTNKAGTYLFCSVKNHLYVFDLKSGKVVGSWIDDVDITTKLKKQQQEKIKALETLAQKEAIEESNNDTKSEADDETVKKLKTNNSKPIKVPKIPTPGPGAPPIYNFIRSLTLSQDETYLVGTTDSDKAVIIFQLDFASDNCLKLIKRQVFPKRPCAVSIVDNNTLAVADKFGDVIQINIDANDPVDEKTLVPILGHVSMLSDVLVTKHENKKYILTGDRDEHIRVSHFPKSYVIRNWLWGHNEFVSGMHIPEWDSSILISGGGDDFVCIWKWFDSKLLQKVELRNLAQSFLTDSHLPPERFLTEDSMREISVSSLLTFNNPKSNRKSLVVLIENTKCLLVFDINSNFEVKHKQTLEVEFPIVDIALDQTNGRIIASLDKEASNGLLQFYEFNDENELSVLENSTVIDTISDANECEVESHKDFYPLYYVNTLRKRSEH